MSKLKSLFFLFWSIYVHSHTQCHIEVLLIDHSFYFVCVSVRVCSLSSRHTHPHHQQSELDGFFKSLD